MLREKLVERNIGGERGFRWRSPEILRIEGFSDAVFALAVTLLVVSLEVPRTFDALLESMSGFIAFAIGFALLLVIWYSQYKFFRRYGLQDWVTLTLNGVLLFVILFFVYPLKFLFGVLVKAFSGEAPALRLIDGSAVPAIRPEQWPLLMTIYGLGYIAIFSMLVLLYFHAYRKRRQLELTTLEEFDTRTSIREQLVTIGVGVLSLLIVGISGGKAAGWAGMVYMLLGPALTVHGAMSGQRRRTLETELSKKAEAKTTETR